MKEMMLQFIEGLKDFYDDRRIDIEHEGKNYFIATLRDDIELGLKENMENEVIKDIVNDFDYSILETEEEKEEYIDIHMTDRFFKLSENIRTEIYNTVVKYFKELGYECYEGQFFPCDGQFKNLNDGQIAFVK